MATAELLLTLEAFCRLVPERRMVELVKGAIVEMNPPTFRHGAVCIEVAAILRNYVKPKQLGRVIGNDSGVITTRNPDTLRGPDVAFYSVARIPTGQIQTRYPEVSPDLVCEVMSEHDRWKEVMGKAAEYLEAGVTAVCIFHPDHETITIVRGDREPEVLHANDDFTLPEILGEFRVAVREFFA